MVKVLLHIRDSKTENWKHRCLELSRIPNIGEFVTLSEESEPYKVELVVHTPYETSEKCAAEVYIKKASHLLTSMGYYESHLRFQN